MKIEIKSKKENKLLDRTEIDFEVDHENAPTPTRESVRDVFSAKQGADHKLVSIVKLESLRGASAAKGRAHVYKTEKSLLETEPKYVQKRHASEKKEEAQPEAPKEAAPAEAPKEVKE